MTIERNQPTGAGHAGASRNHHDEDQLQAYLRRRHETSLRHSTDGQEPARGRDPWLGLAL